MTEKEYQNKMQNLEQVESISYKLFQETGRIAYYGAVCGARDLQRKYIKERNSQTNER